MAEPGISSQNIKTVAQATSVGDTDDVLILAAVSGDKKLRRVSGEKVKEMAAESAMAALGLSIVDGGISQTYEDA
jgi:hypothetical protein